MKFVLGIKPTVITGWGTTFHAKDRFIRSIKGCFCSSSQFGSAYVDTFGINVKYVYGYNIEVFKRGKHRKNKHYALYVYKIDLRILDILGMKINQHQRYFRIVPKKK